MPCRAVKICAFLSMILSVLFKMKFKINLFLCSEQILRTVSSYYKRILYVKNVSFTNNPSQMNKLTWLTHSFWKTLKQWLPTRRRYWVIQFISRANRDLLAGNNVTYCLQESNKWQQQECQEITIGMWTALKSSIPMSHKHALLTTGNPKHKHVLSYVKSLRASTFRSSMHIVFGFPHITLSQWRK